MASYRSGKLSRRGSERSLDSVDEDDGNDESDTESMKARKEQIAAMKKEKINVNTNTKIETESKAKRDRLDEAVRKILLYKDM